MFKNKSLIVLLIAVFLITACAPASAPTQPPATAPAEQLPSATGTQAAASTPAGKFEGLSTGLDNSKQARIRSISMVMGASRTDVYVNGKPAFNGGVAQQNVSTGHFSGWLYVAPGTYTIALVPHDGSMDQALFAPEKISVEAGQRYTVAAIGQLADKDVHALVVNETARETKLGTGISDSVTIDINNVTGVDSISLQAYGKTGAADIKYGEARAWSMQSGNPKYTLQVTVNGTTQTAWEDSIWAEPGISVAEPWFGPFPPTNTDDIGKASQGTSELNVPDFLAGFDGRNVKVNGHLLTFNTFLKLVDKAGLRDQLVNSGPYFLIAPTDEAFSALSPAELETLANDPKALMNLLNAHIVDGYFPYGSLSGPTYGQADRILTNRLGQKLAFLGDNLNDRPTGPNYSVGNGNRVQVIYTLLPSK